MGDESAIPRDTGWWNAMRDDPDPVAAIRHFVRGAAAPLFQRASGLGEVLRGAALTDDEVRDIHAHHEHLRATGFREVVDVVANKAPLRDGLTIDTATDILLVTVSDAAYVQPTQERGWSHDAVIEWFCDALPRLLIDAT